MRVIQSFERKLQGAVGNTFARLFGGTVQPAEVADALQREAADHVQQQDGHVDRPELTTACGSVRPTGRCSAPTKRVSPPRCRT